MASKPEKIPRRSRSYLSKNAMVRAARYTKRVTSKLMRRLARLDPEAAPTRRPLRGWVD